MKNLIFVMAIIASVIAFSCNDEVVEPIDSENAVSKSDTVFITDTLLKTDTLIITDSIFIYNTDTIYQIDTIVIIDTIVELKYNISGFVQKGPYINGTSITIHELDEMLIQTGKNYSTQILDNKGTFGLDNILFESPYVEIKADGFYFNEVNNETTTSQLTLYAIADLSQNSSININVLSYLEKARIQYLLNNGIQFENAKRQAQGEVLSIFNIDNSNIPNSELLDISNGAEENAVLIAVSAILQGHRTIGELAELLANISTDIREDGELNSDNSKSALINAALIIDQQQIRTNIENRYENFGQSISVANFESIINHFIETTEFVNTDKIEYPENGSYGKNLLYPNQDAYPEGDYSLTAILPEGYSLRVRTVGSGVGAYYPQAENSGWDSEFISSSGNVYIYEYTSNRTGTIDYKMNSHMNDYNGPTEILVYENGATDPTFSKVVSADGNAGFNIPENGTYGLNVFSLSDSTTILTDTTYSMAATIPGDKDYDIEIKIYFDTPNTYTIDTTQNLGWQVYKSESELRLSYYGKSKVLDMPIQFNGHGSISIEGHVLIHGINW